MFNKIKVVILCLILSFVSFTNPSVAWASDVNYNSTYIKSMDTKITANDNFTFHVERKITAYLDNNHGIFVNVSYQPGISRIHNIDIKGPYRHEVSQSDESNHKMAIKTIKLGDKNKTHTGFKTWTISYDIQGFKQASDDKDQLSLSLLPAYFELPIEIAKTTVVLPKSVNFAKAKILSGNPDIKPYDLKTDSLFTYKTTDKTLEIVGRNLPSKYGANLQMILPNGYWTHEAVRNNYSYVILSIIVILLIISVVGFFKYGRDQKVVEVIEFYPPDNMDPLTLGYMVDGKVNKKDIISMFFYFANQGLVEIKYVNTKSSRKPKIEIVKLKDIPQTAPDYQKQLFNCTFDQGNVFKTYEVNEDFINCLDEVEHKMIEASPKIYDKTSKKVQSLVLYSIISMIFIIIMGFGIYFGQNYLIMFSLAIVCSVCAYFVAKNSSSLQSKKQDMGINSSFLNRLIFVGYSLALVGLFSLSLWMLTNDILVSVICSGLLIVSLVISELIKKTNKDILALEGRIRGFKTFIKTAELDRLNMLVEQDPEYFYNILPYAYIFGLTDKWAKHFESIPLQTPEWLVGGLIDVYNTVVIFDTVINTTMQQVTNYQISENSKSIISSSRSSGSGINSSGGGFGGGGGGAW